MRKILFRGRDIAHNWHYGAPLVFTENYVCITAPHTYNKSVEIDTIGQYTGLTDKNGTKIFEDDIVTGLFLHSMPVNGVVAFRDGSFGLLWDRAGAATFTPFTSTCNVEYEVIGNIHDNPELLTKNSTKTAEHTPQK